MIAANKIEQLLRLSALLIFIGIGGEHFVSEQPYLKISPALAPLSTLFGILILTSSFLLFIPSKSLRKTRITYFLTIPTILLFLHSFGKFVASGYLAEQMVEHAIKLFTPLVFILFTIKKIDLSKTLMLLKIITAFTFIGHAFFALGVHSIPGSFLNMTGSILGLSIEHSILFLKIIGVLDIVFALLLFASNNRIVLGYLIIWGILTAVARFYYGVQHYNLPGNDLYYWTLNMIFRLPHGIIPMVIWLIVRNFNRRYTFAA